MRRLKILMIAACPFPAPRGTPTRILKLAEGVAELGHEVHVVAYHLGERLDDSAFSLHRISDVAGYRRTESGPSYGKLWVDWKLARKAKSLLHDIQFDLIHAHHYEGLLVGFVARRGMQIPIIYDSHTLAGIELPDYPLGLPRRVLRWLGTRLDRNLPGLADYCVAASGRLAEALVAESKVEPRRVSVVTNGVELDYFDRPRRSEIGNGMQRLVYTGNLAPFQGVDLLLEMFAALCDDRNDVELVIATNDDTAVLEAAVLELGLAGKVEIRKSDFAQLPDLLASAAVALNPRPRCDGVPQKLLNYMAAGCPVVSMAGSAPHVEHGRSAYLVDEPSSTSLLAGVQCLLNDLEMARRLGGEARKVAERKLGWARAANVAVEVYEKVLAT